MVYNVGISEDRFGDTRGYHTAYAVDDSIYPRGERVMA